MKEIEKQNYDEIPEISPPATAKEIEKAYEQAKQAFHSDSMAIDSLFPEKEINGIRTAMDKAYQALMDENLRTHDGQSPPSPRLSSLSFTDISVNPNKDGTSGKTLKEIREKMGIDLKSVFQKTRINVKILQWIEEEALEKLPALPYVKGFLRAYAQFLGLDPQKVTEGYLGLFKESKKK